MEDIEHVFAGATNLLLVVEPCDKFPKGVYRAYAMRDGKPKSAYVMNPDERAGKGNVVKWTEIKKEHKYAKYDDIGYWLAWKRLVGVPKKRSREQLLHDWWHAVAEARQHGRVAPTLSSVIDTYVESKRPANDEGAAAQSSSMTKPEESVLPRPEFHDTETRKNVAGRNTLYFSTPLDSHNSSRAQEHPPLSTSVLAARITMEPSKPEESNASLLLEQIDRTETRIKALENSIEDADRAIDELDAEILKIRDSNPKMMHSNSGAMLNLAMLNKLDVGTVEKGFDYATRLLNGFIKDMQAAKDNGEYAAFKERIEELKAYSEKIKNRLVSSGGGATITTLAEALDHLAETQLTPEGLTPEMHKRIMKFYPRGRKKSDDAVLGASTLLNADADADADAETGEDEERGSEQDGENDGSQETEEVEVDEV